VEQKPISVGTSVAGAKGLLWYPKAVKPARKMPTRGLYSGGYPQGAVVHFTAGRDKTEQDALGTYSWGCDEGYTFFVIGPTGIVYQGFPLNEWGSHAGVSKWPSLGSSVSTKLVGIEVACAGELDKNRKSWFGVTYPENEVRYVTEAAYGCPTGNYKKFTEAQEKSLVELLTWLKTNNSKFNPDLILGHHEVSGKKGIGSWRKNDPGGALSMTMDQLRAKIKAAK